MSKVFNVTEYGILFLYEIENDILKTPSYSRGIIDLLNGKIFVDMKSYIKIVPIIKYIQETFNINNSCIIDWKRKNIKYVFDINIGDINFYSDYVMIGLIKRKIFDKIKKVEKKDEQPNPLTLKINITKENNDDKYSICYYKNKPYNANVLYFDKNNNISYKLAQNVKDKNIIRVKINKYVKNEIDIINDMVLIYILILDYARYITYDSEYIKKYKKNVIYKEPTEIEISGYRAQFNESAVIGSFSVAKSDNKRRPLIVNKEIYDITDSKQRMKYEFIFLNNKFIEYYICSNNLNYIYLKTFPNLYLNSIELVPSCYMKFKKSEGKKKLITKKSTKRSKLSTPLTLGNLSEVFLFSLSKIEDLDRYYVKKVGTRTNKGTYNIIEALVLFDIFNTKKPFFNHIGNNKANMHKEIDVEVNKYLRKIRNYVKSEDFKMNEFKQFSYMTKNNFISFLKYKGLDLNPIMFVDIIERALNVNIIILKFEDKKYLKFLERINKNYPTNKNKKTYTIICGHPNNPIIPNKNIYVCEPIIYTTNDIKLNKYIVELIGKTMIDLLHENIYNVKSKFIKPEKEIEFIETKIDKIEKIDKFKEYKLLTHKVQSLFLWIFAHYIKYEYEYKNIDCNFQDIFNKFKNKYIEINNEQDDFKVYHPLLFKMKLRPKKSMEEIIKYIKDTFTLDKLIFKSNFITQLKTIIFSIDTCRNIRSWSSIMQREKHFIEKFYFGFEDFNIKYNEGNILFRNNQQYISLLDKLYSYKYLINIKEMLNVPYNFSFLTTDNKNNLYVVKNVKFNKQSYKINTDNPLDKKFKKKSIYKYIYDNFRKEPIEIVELVGVGMSNYGFTYANIENLFAIIIYPNKELVKNSDNHFGIVLPYNF